MSRDPTAFLERRVSARMRAIVDCLEDGRPTWDLCCDHGRIGLWAWWTRSLPELHFVDRVPSVIESLKRDVARLAGGSSIGFHPVDAASIVLPERPCNVILSGVGFRAFTRIVAALYAKPRADRLVVSVHAEAELLAPYLERTGWRLNRGVDVDEAGRVRSITAWDGSASTGADRATLVVSGPRGARLRSRVGTTR